MSTEHLPDDWSNEEKAEWRAQEVMTPSSQTAEHKQFELDTDGLASWITPLRPFWLTTKCPKCGGTARCGFDQIEDPHYKTTLGFECIACEHDFNRPVSFVRTVWTLQVDADVECLQGEAAYDYSGEPLDAAEEDEI